MIVDLDLTFGHLVQALVDNAQRLAELFNAAQVAIVAVAILANRDVELNLVVRVVWLSFPVRLKCVSQRRTEPVTR